MQEAGHFKKRLRVKDERWIENVYAGTMFDDPNMVRCRMFGNPKVANPQG
jgi:hypothetical protein